jgi:general secretion pathway protein E
MAQRLIRKLDDSIKQAYQPSQFELYRINEIMSSLPADSAKPNLDGLQLYKPGQSDDNPFGYDGQLAIREQMTMTDNLRQLLEDPKTQITAQAIEAIAIKDGMTTMLQDGALKVIEGQTSLDELSRVIE